MLISHHGKLQFGVVQGCVTAHVHRGNSNIQSLVQSAEIISNRTSPTTIRILTSHTSFLSLEDYLLEIASVVQEEQAHISPEATNFAQAALLLHNSSNVYSRKVEYLYTLVYAALDNLNSQQAIKNKQNSSRKVDAEIEEFEQFDEHVEFLLLDDVIPIGEDKIDLPCRGGIHQLDASGFLPSTTRLSLGISATVDRSTIGVMQNAVLSTLSNSCGVLQQTDGNSLGMFYMRGTSDFQGPKNRLSSFGSALNTSGDEMMLQQEEGDDNGNFSDNDDDGPGFEIAESMVQSLPDPPKPETRRQLKKPHAAWDLMDPHDTEQVKGRPLRIGTTYLLPEGLLEPPSQFVTGARTKKHVVKEKQRHIVVDEPQHICIAAATFKATMANEQRRRERLPNNNDPLLVQDLAVDRPIVPIQGLAFGGEFAYIAKAATKRKAAERREKRKLLQQEPEAIPCNEADQLLGYDDGNDYGGGDDDSFGDDNDNGNNGGFQVFDEATSPSDNGECCAEHLRCPTILPFPNT